MQPYALLRCTSLCDPAPSEQYAGAVSKLQGVHSARAAAPGNGIRALLPYVSEPSAGRVTPEGCDAACAGRALSGSPGLSRHPHALRTVRAALRGPGQARSPRPGRQRSLLARAHDTSRSAPSGRGRSRSPGGRHVTSAPPSIFLGPAVS